MYSYEWDEETGGILLNSSPLDFSKEPRPVYYKELDILGFDEYWNYDKNDTYPYMWAEANNYWYRGRKVAKTKGGSLYNKPEIIIYEEPEQNNQKLRFVDIMGMVEKNRDILENLVQETIKKLYNTYTEYRDRVDVFYVAFSGGKDSVVALDIVQRSLPHNIFKVLFGDTGMEFPDTYDVITKTSEWCKKNGIEFLKAKSKLDDDKSWQIFGPPAVTNRWCCGVHKTSPQIMLLKELTKIKDFTGMAFTGVRGDESASRKEYSDINFGAKHQGQFSYHAILEWNSAEIYLYIYERNLLLNETYKKGNPRAGCLVCPMSSGKHEYFKKISYADEVERLIRKIRDTSGKEYFSYEEMTDFIDKGNWKTRKSGKELNLGYDKHIVDVDKGNPVVTVFKLNDNWKEWAKTIGELIEYSDNVYSIDYQGEAYNIKLKQTSQGTVFSFPNYNSSKKDIKFISLFKSCLIKSTYCVTCGVCVAECPFGCIDMSNGLKISDECTRCHKCHDIHEHCLHYNSIRNKIGVEKKMKGLGNYYSFGVREEWVDKFFKYDGGAEFWDTDGDSMVANKKKDAFLNFIRDAELVVRNKSIGHDKYTRYELSDFGNKILFLHNEQEYEILWALMLSNLVYTANFNWFIKNISLNENITPDIMRFKLESFMEEDKKGLGKRNVTDAFKIMLIKTPLGCKLGLGNCNYEEKLDSAGRESISLSSFHRSSWQNPDPRVILYSLYKFAEGCGDYYSFTLTRLLNHDIDSDGVSPTEIFGLDRSSMEKLLNGMSVNYPEFINASFTHDLDNITLRVEKTSKDVLSLF